MPPVLLEIYSPFTRHTKTFAFEQQLLCDPVRAGKTDAAACIHNSVPGDGRSTGQGVQCVSDLPRAAALSNQTGNLTIGCNAPSGNASHRGVDASVDGVVWHYNFDFGRVTTREPTARAGNRINDRKPGAPNSADASMAAAQRMAFATKYFLSI